METTTEICILIRCSQPVLDGEGALTLSDGGRMHMECVWDWRANGGALRPREAKKES